MKKQEVENQFIEAKRNFGHKFRLIYKDGEYKIQHFHIRTKWWRHTKDIPIEPTVGIWSIFGIGDLEFNDQKLYAKKCFIDFVTQKKNIGEITIL